MGALFVACSLGMTPCEQPKTDEDMFCRLQLDLYGATLENDRRHCGTCWHPCAADEMCLDGECALDRGWALWSIPELPRSDDQFEVRGEIARDLVTQLEWQRQVSQQAISIDDAAAQCESLELDGRGWRLPTRMELLSIVDYSRASPAINTQVFPNTPSGAFSHTPSIDVAPLTEADPYDTIDFAEGTLSGYDSEGRSLITGREQFVRCTRVGRSSVPVGQHYDVGPATVLDRITGLRWARVPSLPCTRNGGCTVTTVLPRHVVNAQYCDDLEADGYDDFRLPTLHELLSLFPPRKYGFTHLRIDEDAFPSDADDTFDPMFDTSTTVASMPDLTWSVSFSSGVMSSRVGRRVRCVRAE